jgi:hypothetical protein
MTGGWQLAAGCRRGSRLAASAALVLLGCGAQAGADSDAGDDLASAETDSAGIGDGGQAPETGDEIAGVVVGDLIEAHLPSAQSRLCITLEESFVSAIDGISCEHLPPNNALCGACEAWSYCNGCLLVLETFDGHTILTARRGPACTVYAGSYALSVAKSCFPQPSL